MLISSNSGDLLNCNRVLLQELSGAALRHIKELKNLHTIIVDGAYVSGSSFEIISDMCKSLVEIGLSKCIGVTNLGIMKLVPGCVNLRVLNLTCCAAITDVAISAVAESCKNLVCLKLESCNMITEKCLYQIGSCLMLLEEIDLTDCSSVNDQGKI